MSPVSLSVTVPSPLSTKRRVVVVVLVVVLVVVVLLVGVVLLVVVDVLVLVVVVGVAHSPAVQAPLQHWLFAVQVARFGLQLALLGAAPALRGVPTRSARAANIAAKPPRARCDMCCISRGAGVMGKRWSCLLQVARRSLPPSKQRQRALPGRSLCRRGLPSRPAAV